MDKSFQRLNTLKTKDLTKDLRASLMKWAKIHETFRSLFFYTYIHGKFPAPQL